MLSRGCTVACGTLEKTTEVGRRRYASAERARNHHVRVLVVLARALCGYADGCPAARRDGSSRGDLKPPGAVRCESQTGKYSCAPRNECKWPICRACRRPGLRKITWQVLRHTFASHLVDERYPAEGGAGADEPRDDDPRYSHLSPQVGCVSGTSRLPDDSAPRAAR